MPPAAAIGSFRSRVIRSFSTTKLRLRFFDGAPGPCWFPTQVSRAENDSRSSEAHPAKVHGRACELKRPRIRVSGPQMRPTVSPGDHNPGSNEHIRNLPPLQRRSTGETATLALLWLLVTGSSPRSPIGSLECRRVVSTDCGHLAGLIGNPGSKGGKCLRLELWVVVHIGEPGMEGTRRAVD